MLEILEYIAAYGLVALYFLSPIAAIVWFVISMVKLKRTPPDAPEHKRRKLFAVISGWVMSVVLAVVIGLALLFMIAVTHM